MTAEAQMSQNAVNDLNAVSHTPAKWYLEIEALPGKPGDPAAGYRLKGVLKRLLRSYGFKCTGIKEKS